METRTAPNKRSSKNLLMRLSAAFILLGFICISLALYSWISRYGVIENWTGPIDDRLFERLSQISPVERLVGTVGGILGLSGIIGLIISFVKK